MTDIVGFLCRTGFIRYLLYMIKEKCNMIEQKLELTIKAVVIGLILSIVFCGTNIYLTLELIILQTLKLIK